MLVGLVDIFLVGHLTATVAAQLGYPSATALAGVGLAGYIIWITTTLFTAVAAGTTALVARSIGAGDERTARSALRQSMLLGTLVGVLTGLAIYIFAPQTIGLFGPEPDVLPLAVEFLRITAWSMPLAGLLFIGTAALRGAGDTKTPLLVMLLVNGLNMVVAFLLVNGQFSLPALGVAGSAWGATLGRGVGGLIVIAVLLRGRGGLHFRGWPRPEWHMLKRILRVGLPTGAEMLVFQAALVLFARQITGLGTIAYAAHNTVVTIESVSFLPGFGFGVAATTLVGQGLGAKNARESRASANEAFLQGVLFMSFMGLLFILIPRPLLGLLVNDPKVIEAGIMPLRVVGLIQPLLAANFIYSGALRGAGDTRFPLLVKLISPWLLRLPMAWLLIPQLGLLGGWIAMSSDLAIQGVLSWWRFRGEHWERIEV